MRLSLGAHVVAAGELSLRMLLSQVVEDCTGLRQEPAIVLTQGRYSTGRIDREKLSRAILHPDGLVWRADPFEGYVGRQRARAYGIIECGHDFMATFLVNRELGTLG